MIWLGALCLALTQERARPAPVKPIRPDLYQAPMRGTLLSQYSVKIFRPRRPEHSAIVRFAVPQDYTGQILTDFKVECNAPGVLKSWKWIKSPGGIHDYVEAFYSDANESTVLSFSARVFAPVEEVFRTQKKDFANWNKPSAAIQSRDSDIKALATKLKADHNSEDDFVKSVVEWVSRNHWREAGRASDAKSCFNYGGDSLAHANLCAAIFRASGVAARVAAYLPTTTIESKKPQWLTEYQADEGTWQMVEPTVGLTLVPRNSVVILSIPPDGETSPVDVIERADPTTIRALSVPKAPRVVVAALTRRKTVVASALKGKNAWLDDTDYAKALASSLTNFALFIEGKPMMNKQM